MLEIGKSYKFIGQKGDDYGVERIGHVKNETMERADGSVLVKVEYENDSAWNWHNVQTGISNAGFWALKEQEGYHLATIKRGVYGELSKIREELDEMADGEAQSNKLLVYQEASDLLGALEAYILKYSNNSVTLQDLIKMNECTKRAFASGHRQNRDGK